MRGFVSRGSSLNLRLSVPQKDILSREVRERMVLFQTNPLSYVRGSVNSVQPTASTTADIEPFDRGMRQSAPYP